MDASVALSLAGLGIVLIGLVGGLTAWVMRRIDHVGERLREHGADDIRAHDDMRQWCRELFASRTDLARVEERIKAIEDAIADVRETAHEIRAMLVESNRR